MIERLKSLLRDQIGLPTWVVLAAAGLAAHIVLNVLLRKPVTSAWGLLAPLSLGCLMEAYEIWVQYRHVGLFAPANDPLFVILGRHGLDVLVMLALPALLVAAGSLSSK